MANIQIQTSNYIAIKQPCRQIRESKQKDTELKFYKVMAAPTLL